MLYYNKKDGGFMWGTISNISAILGEIIPTTQIEIKRSDYTIITFDIYESGKNGHLITSNYKFKLTFKGVLYHLCA